MRTRSPLLPSLLTVVATLLTVTIAPRMLAAQTIPSPYRFIENAQELGVVVGHFGADPGRLELGPLPGTLVGLRYGVAVSGPLALEGMLFTVPTERDVIDPARIEGNRSIGRVDATLLGIDARLRFAVTGRRTWNGLQPFLSIGGGLLWDSEGTTAFEEEELPEEDVYEFGTEFTGVFGGGARWIVSDRLMVRGDLGLTLYQIEAPAGFLDPAREIEDAAESEWVDATRFTLGVAWTF